MTKKNIEVDILESGIPDDILRILLKDHTTSTKDIQHIIFWATRDAYKSLYGFEWQGDNLLLAREAMLYSFSDYYKQKFGKEPHKGISKTHCLHHFMEPLANGRT